MSKINILLELIKEDKDITQFKTQHDKMCNLSQEIRNLSKDYIFNLNSITRNAIKEKRILVDIIEDANKRNTYFDKIGLGTQGFGSCWRYGSHLSEDNVGIIRFKNLIIANYDVFKEGLKRNYTDRFDKFINALKIFPTFANDIDTILPIPIDEDLFDGDSKSCNYSAIRGHTSLLQYTRDEIRILSKGEESEKYTGKVLYPEDLNNIVDYYLVIPIINNVLIKHNEKLEAIHKSLIDFSNSKEYQAVLNEIVTIKMLREL
jgi:hypothetical protein